MSDIGRGENQAIQTTKIKVAETTVCCKIIPTTLQGDSGEMQGSATWVRWQCATVGANGPK